MERDTVKIHFLVKFLSERAEKALTYQTKI